MSNKITPDMIVPGVTVIRSYYSGGSYLVESVVEDTENGIAGTRGGPLVPAVKLNLRVTHRRVRGVMQERVPADAALTLGTLA